MDQRCIIVHHSFFSTPSQTLIAHIKKTLPELKQRLHKRLGDVTRELAIMNSPFDGIDERLLKKDRATGNVSEMGVDPVAMQNVLMNVVRKFCSTIKRKHCVGTWLSLLFNHAACSSDSRLVIIDGHDGDLNSDAFGDLNFVTGRMHQFSLDSGTEQAPPVSPLELNTAVRIKFVFLERFPQTLMRLEDLLLSSEMDAELRTMILNARGLRAGLFVPDSVLEILIKRHVLQLEPIAIECVNGRRVHCVIGSCVFP